MQYDYAPDADDSQFDLELPDLSNFEDYDFAPEREDSDDPDTTMSMEEFDRMAEENQQRINKPVENLEYSRISNSVEDQNHVQDVVETESILKELEESLAAQRVSNSQAEAPRSMNQSRASEQRRLVNESSLSDVLPHKPNAAKSTAETRANDPDFENHNLFFSKGLEMFGNTSTMTGLRNQKIRQMRQLLELFCEEYFRYFSEREYNYRRDPNSRPQFEIYDEKKFNMAFSISEVTVIYYIKSKQIVKKNPRGHPRIVEAYFGALSQFLREKELGFVQDFYWTSNKKLVFTFKNTPFSFVFKLNDWVEGKRLKLIDAYSRVDPRLKTMGSFLLHWAQQRKLLGGSRSMKLGNRKADQAVVTDILTPTALYFMLIYFLSIQDPPVLPSLHLQELNKRAFLTIPGPKIKGKKERQMIKTPVDLNYDFDLSQHKGTPMEMNKNSTGELMRRFFYTFAYVIPSQQKQMSLRRRAQPGPKPYKFNIFKEGPGYTFEDPMIENWDLFILLQKNTMKFHILRDEFKRADKLIKAKRIEELCFQHHEEIIQEEDSDEND